MKIGVYLPQVGPAATRENMLGSATAAEECGFDSIWVFDHVVLQKEQGSRYPYAADGRLAIPPTVDFLEPLTSLRADRCSTCEGMERARPGHPRQRRARGWP